MTDNFNSLLGVNIDHIATLRQARGTVYPDPINAALLAEQAGADSITVHLREDRRHIQDNDVITLRKVIKTKLNLEMAVTEEMLHIVQQVKPDDCCLVPEKRQELTTEGGLDVINQLDTIKSACEQLKQAEIAVSLFIDPDIQQIDAAQQAGATAIEIHTGLYANSDSESQRLQYLAEIKKAIKYAKQLGLTVNAGHGLNYHNVQPIAKLPGLHTLNIGHAIIARSIFCGLPEAIQLMKSLMSS